MNHRTQILNGTKKTVAVCSCKWVGPDRTNQEDARKDAADHVIAELKASGVRVVEHGPRG